MPVHLTLAFRRIIYSCFILAFLIAAPLVVFYAMGYRYSFLKEKIERTGVLIVSFSPADARLTLNGTVPDMQRDGNVAHIANLLPGIYTITLSADGYQPVTRIVSIAPNQSSVYKYLTLFPENPQPVLLQQGVFTALTMQGETLILTSQTATSSQIVFTDARYNAPQRFFIPETASTTPMVIPMGYGRWSAVQFATGALYVLDRQEGRVLELAALHTTSAVWMPDTVNPELFALEDGYLTRYTFDQNSMPIAMDRTRTLQTLTHLQRTIYGITLPEDTGTVELIQWQPQQKTWEKVLDLPFSQGYAFAETAKSFLTILDTANTILYLVTAAPTKPPELFHISPRVDGVFWYADGAQLLTHNEFEIAHLAFLETFGTQAYERTILRVSTPVTNVLLHPLATHLLFAQNNSLTIASLEDQPVPDIISYAHFDSLTAFVVHPTKEALLVIGTLHGIQGLYEVPLAMKK